MTTYIEYEGQAVTYPDYFGQECEIIEAVPDETDPDPTCDWYMVRFADGRTALVAPEELSPIPVVGTKR